MHVLEMEAGRRAAGAIRLEETLGMEILRRAPFRIQAP
jgi:hypothetical protein